MSRLIVLPMQPGSRSGYEQAVRSDIARLQLTPDDLVVVYDSTHDGSVGHVLKRPHRLAPIRYVNSLRLRPSTEVTASQLASIVARRSFESIFAGDVIFYRALRSLFPGTNLAVRLHNYFSLVRSRNEYYRYPIDPLFRANIHAFSRLEKEIARDPLVTSIFITDEERRFYLLHYPGGSTELWPIEPAEIRQAVAPTKARLIWFGGIAHHKRHAVRTFLSQTLPEIRRRRSDLECHLFGHGTEAFNSPADKIFGSGSYEGPGLPFDGDGLFINPDLLGGGVKVKVGFLLEQGAAFISTPFGLEGNVIPPSEHILVADLADWADLVVEYFNGHVPVSR